MKKLIDIIIPVYNEEKQIARSFEMICAHLPYEHADFTFTFIDDGSADKTWDALCMLSAETPGVKVLKLSRNFGKEAALCAGLENFSGDACIVMDSDLQHPPELIPDMVRLWLVDGYEIIEGVKSSRGKESIVNKLGAKLFYYLMRKLSGVEMKNASDFKLMDAKVVEAWKKMNEHDTFMRGMTAWLGFRKCSIPFSVAPRMHGASRWSFFKLFRLAFSAITSFSSLPLHLVTVLGMILFAGSFILGIQTIYQKLSGHAIEGFTTIILLQLIIGSVLMISLGIIGSYIARIFNEVKMRPRYIVSELRGEAQGIAKRSVK